MEMAGVVGLEEGVALEAASWGVESGVWAGAAPTAAFTPRATSCFITNDKAEYNT